MNYIPNSIASALSSKQFGRVAFILDPKRQTQAIDQIFMQYHMGGLDIAKELEKNGVVCLRHDCIGSGESDGLPEEATTSTEAEDTAAVMEYARTLPQVDPEKILVGGHSLGARAAVMAAEKANAAGLVLLRHFPAIMS